ncbi:DNA primase, partial [Mesorhizobium sp. M5C.F.Ca.IN.020.14.1.1]
DEARSFLAMPAACLDRPTKPLPAPTGSSEASRRLVAMSKPIIGTLVQTYLRGRGITALHGTGALRFHPHCYYRPDDYGPTETWPAMIAAVTDLDGQLTGAHRTWLAPDGSGKAPIETPRRAMGDLLGHAVRFGVPGDVMAAGEGIETTMSLRCAMPDMAMAAALSAAHLAAILFPPTLHRLYVIRDNDPAGDGARDGLIERATDAGIEAIVLSPVTDDFNEDLRHFGLAALRASIADQLMHRDRFRYLKQAA